MIDRNDRNPRVCQWELDLLADTAARVDSIAAVLAARLLTAGWDDDLAAVIAALERIGADLARLELEHRTAAAS